MEKVLDIVSKTAYYSLPRWLIAQLVEQAAVNRPVIGSSPIQPASVLLRGVLLESIPLREVSSL